jgi:hypothetical protein
LGTKLAILTQIITFLFKKNANYFTLNIARNNDHNYDLHMINKASQNIFIVLYVCKGIMAHVFVLLQPALWKYSEVATSCTLGTSYTVGQQE